MSKIRLYGSTSGYIDLAAPAVADDATLTLPTGADGFASEAYVDAAIPAAIGDNVVYAQAAQFSTTSTSLVNVTGASVTITPTSGTSKIFVMATCPRTIQSSANSKAIFRVQYNGSTDISTEALMQGADSTSQTQFGLISPSSTTPITFQVKVRVDGGTGTWNKTEIIAMEVAA